jgi:hypothetical protein
MAYNETCDGMAWLVTSLESHRAYWDEHVMKYHNPVYRNKYVWLIFSQSMRKVESVYCTFSHFIKVTVKTMRNHGIPLLTPCDDQVVEDHETRLVKRINYFILFIRIYFFKQGCDSSSQTWHKNVTLGKLLKRMHLLRKSAINRGSKPVMFQYVIGDSVLMWLITCQ